MKKRYLGCCRWWVKLKGQPAIEVDVQTTTGNRHEDEGMARYYARKKLGVNRLPPGTTAYPQSDL